MAANLPNVIVPNSQWIDLYAVTGIDIGIKIVVHNTGASDVRLSTALFQPTIDSDSYQLLQPNDFPMTNDQGDVGAWVFSANQTGKVNVRVAK